MALPHAEGIGIDVTPHIAGSLHAAQAGGSGIPILFVHPNPANHRFWMYQMAHFSTWFRTIAPDLPGYGASPVAGPGLTMAEVAEACWEAVDAVTSDPAVLVGNSVGANVVLHMSSQRPGRTVALIMSGCGYTPDKGFARMRIAQYQESGVAFRRNHALEGFGARFRDSDLAGYLVDTVAGDETPADLATIIEMFRALGEPDPEWLFDDVQAPTLIITGSEDYAHPGAFALQRRIRDCELVTLEGAGHSCSLERPWEWDAHALRFLAAHGLHPV